MIYRRVKVLDGSPCPGCPAPWMTRNTWYPIQKINGIDTVIGPNGEYLGEDNLSDRLWKFEYDLHWIED